MSSVFVQGASYSMLYYWAHIILTSHFTLIIFLSRSPPQPPQNQSSTHEHGGSTPFVIPLYHNGWVCDTIVPFWLPLVGFHPLVSPWSTEWLQDPHSTIQGGRSVPKRTELCYAVCIQVHRGCPATNQGTAQGLKDMKGPHAPYWCWQL